MSSTTAWNASRRCLVRRLAGDQVAVEISTLMLAVVIVGSIVGSLVVAHIIGFIETITTTVVAAELRGVFTMVLIIAVLVIRPKGLFGREEL